MIDAVDLTRDLIRRPSVTPADAGAMAVLETSPETRSAPVAKALDELRDLRKRKEESLEKAGDDHSGMVSPRA